MAPAKQISSLVIVASLIIINIVFGSSWGSPLSHSSITMFFPVVVFHSKIINSVLMAQYFSNSYLFNHNYNKYRVWEFLRKPIKPSVYCYVFPVVVFHSKIIIKNKQRIDDQLPQMAAITLKDLVMYCIIMDGVCE